MAKKQTLPSISPYVSKEVPVEYDAYVGFKDNIKYSQKEFAMLWDAMLKDVDPNIEISTDDQTLFTINSFGMMIKGYACTLGSDVFIDLTDETADIIYLWGKLNLETDLLTFIFETDGEDLTVNDTDTELHRQLGVYKKLSEETNKYTWNKETQFGAGSKLDNLLKPDIVENANGWTVGSTITLPKNVSEYKRMTIFTVREDDNHANIIVDGLLPETRETAGSARADGQWSDGKQLHSYTILFNFPSGSAPNTMRYNTGIAWRHNPTTANPHQSIYKLKIAKIKLYTY